MGHRLQHTHPRGSLLAFTLIELLVVISIIALLLAIILPSLNKVRFQAKSVLCKSNLRQWGLSVNIYANDYNAKLPQQNFGFTGRNLCDVSTEFITFSGYYNTAAGLKEESIMTRYGIVEKDFKYCPHTPAGTVDQLEMYMDWWNPGFTLLLAYSWWVPRESSGTLFPPEYPTTTTDRRASTKPIMTDVIYKTNGYTGDLSDDAILERSLDVVVPGLLNGVYGMHAINGKIIDTNLLFVDGHVETHTRLQIQNHYSAYYMHLY